MSLADKPLPTPRPRVCTGGRNKPKGVGVLMVRCAGANRVSHTYTVYDPEGAERGGKIESVKAAVACFLRTSRSYQQHQQCKCYLTHGE